MPRFAWLESLRARITGRSRTVRRSVRLGAELLEGRDVPALTLTINPQSLASGAVATGTLTRDGDLTASLTVTLASGDPAELAVPGQVTIAAGNSQATFPVTAGTPDAAATVTVTATAQTTQGSPFGLDPTFGTGGLAATPLTMTIQPPHAAIAVQPDGKILAASEYSGTSWQLTRLNPDGSVDTTFGTNGVVVTAFPDPNRNRPVPHTIVVQGDGKILVGGSYGGYSTTQLALLARYNADGTPDTTFGSGGVAGLAPLSNDSVESIAVRSDGRVLLGLEENGSVFTRVAQLTATGAFDPSFGTSGVASLNLGYSAEWVALLPDGRFLAAGSFQSTAGVAMVQASGQALDTTFGTSGVAHLNFPFSGVSSAGVAIDSQGRIVYGADVYNFSGGNSLPGEFAVGRLNPNGSVDATFGTGGTTALDVSGVGANDTVTSMVVQPDNKIVLGGWTDLSTGRDSAMARFNADGTPDSTFGTGGAFHQSLVTTYSADTIFSLALQSDGKLDALTGWASSIKVARFNMGVQTVNLTASAGVNVLDQAPVASNQAVTTNENTAVSGQVAATDADNPTLTYAAVAGPAHGSLKLNSDGTFTYTPATNYYGPDSFTFQANDGRLNSNTATVSFTVAHVNQPPVAVNDTYTATENTPLVVNALSGPGTISLTMVSQTGDYIGQGKTYSFGAGSGTFSMANPYPGNPTYTNAVTVRFSNATESWELDFEAPNDARFVPGTTYTGAARFPFEAASQPGLSVSGDGRGSNTLTGQFTVVEAVYDPSGNLVRFGADFVQHSEGATPALTGSVRYNYLPPGPVGVLTNDTDPDGDPLTAALVTGPQHGSVSLNSDGTFTYTPAANFYGADSFTYVANDGQLNSNVATATITVNQVDQPPVAANQAVTTNENTALSGQVTATDPDSTSLTYAVVTGPQHGTLTLNANGTFTYTPAANYYGSDSFTFKANDGQLDSNTATVSITVKSTDQAPVASNQAVTTNENTAVSGQVTATDPDSPTLTYVAVTGPAHGALTLNANGTFTYTPAANYYGSDSFTFKANDGQLDSNVATVSITVNHVNQPPVAANDAYSTAENTPLVVGAATGQGTNSLTMVSDAGDYIGQGKTYTYGPASGTYSMSNPYPGNPAYANAVTVAFSNATDWWYLDFEAPNDARFVPGTTYTGAARFPFEAASQPGLSVSGDGRGSNTLTGQFTVVEAVYDPSGNLVRFGADFVQHSEGATPALTGSVRYNYVPPGSLGVLANDTDPDGDPLTAALVTGPQHGAVSLNPDGTFTYTPTANFYGTDSFTYLANDGQLNSNVATASITVAHVNQPPVAADQAVTTNENTAANGQVSATDPDSTGLTYSLVTGPQNGTLTLNADGTFSYTPNALFSGSDSFTFKANDGQLDSNVATVSVTVVHVNQPPVAQSLAVTTNENAATSGQVTATDPDSTSLTYAVVTGPQHGTLTLNANGTFTYTPNALFYGSDSFTYKANDGQLDSNVATVSVTVNHVDQPPVAQPLTVSTNENAAVSGQVSATDPDSPTLTYTAVGGPAHGALTLNANGTFTYTPVTNYYGTDSFTFKATDGQLDSNMATVSITVAHVNQPPVAANQAVSTNENAAVNGQVSATDPDSTTLTYAVVVGPAHGSLTLNTNGTFTYTPNALFSGSDSFTFKANDGQLDSNVATVSITVAHVDQPPVASNQVVTTNENAAVSGQVAATDPDSTSLTYVVVTGPAHGTLTLNANGTFTYTPNALYYGSDSFTFKANDGQLDSNVATVSITVTHVNQPPVAQPLSVTTAKRTPVSAKVTATDPDSTTLTYAVVTGPRHGRLVFNTDGTFTYTPANNYTGSDSFTFKANDGQLDSNVATVSITVASRLNQTPTLAPATFSVSKNAPKGASVGTVYGVDDDDDDSLTYSIEGGNAAGAFSIDPKTGRLTVANRAALNGLIPSFSLTVRVKDSDGLTATAVVVVNVA